MHGLRFRVDAGGVAELKGLHAGDQVISVNGESLEGVTHAVAAHTLRSHPELILTVKVSCDTPCDL